MADVEVNVEGGEEEPAAVVVEAPPVEETVAVIEAGAEAQVAVIEAEAEADVARIEAAGEVAAEVAERNIEEELSQCRTQMEALSTENLSLRAETESQRSTILELEARLSPPAPSPSPDESAAVEATPASPEAAEPPKEPAKVRPSHRWI